MPEKGSLEYALLAKEIGNPNGEIPAGFKYKAHIAATRPPKDYPDWIDPIADIDDRWVDWSWEPPTATDPCHLSLFRNLQKGTE